MKINENLYYNGLQKKRYLENCRFEEPTREVIDMWFRQSAKIEAQEKCDLANFTRPQVYNLLQGLNLKSKQTLKVICVYYSDYYSWCISEGLVDSGNIVNQYDLKLVNNIIDEVITRDVIKGKYFNKTKLLEYMNLIPDPSNKFIVYAIFSGVLGYEFKELVNLKIEDIDEINHIVKIETDEKIKEIKIDDMFINLAKEANNQIKYYPNGILELNKTRNISRYNYDKSCYIIKYCSYGTEDTPVTKSIIMSRLRTVQNQTGNKFLNGVTLYKCGLINYITEKFLENGISFKDALLKKERPLDYKYSEEMQEYINEFGSNMNVRMLRMQIAEYVDMFD